MSSLELPITRSLSLELSSYSSWLLPAALAERGGLSWITIAGDRGRRSSGIRYGGSAAVEREEEEGSDEISIHESGEDEWEAIGEGDQNSKYLPFFVLHWRITADRVRVEHELLGHAFASRVAPCMMVSSRPMVK